MDSVLASYRVCGAFKMQNAFIQHSTTSRITTSLSNSIRITAMARSKSSPSRRKLPKNLRYPRRAKIPPDPRVNLFLKKKNTDVKEQTEKVELFDNVDEESDDDDGYDDSDNEDDNDDLDWSPDELDAISSLFQGRVPQKPGILYRERPLPLPMPYKIRPLGLPTPKKHVRTASPSIISSRSTVCNRVYKNPDFLVHLAREIKSLPVEKDVCVVLDKWVRFLRKGSLSLTIRELGRLDLPERALQTFCWAQKHPHLFPDDRILASTIEILARTRGLKMQFDLDKFINSASRSVIDAMAKGFIKGGSLELAWKLTSIAKKTNRLLDPSIHAKLIWELGKNPDKKDLVLALLDELAERDELSLNQQDCTAVMKICIRLGRFDVVESLYNWFKESGRDISVVMYTTLIHSRYTEEKYRDALALVWEMEESNCLFDLPAYRVAIKLFVALNDVSRAVRYFSRLEEADFSPTYDIYRDMIRIYAASGRLAKCKEVCKEIEMAGFKLDKQMEAILLQMEG